MRKKHLFRGIIKTFIINENGLFFTLFDREHNENRKSEIENLSNLYKN